MAETDDIAYSLLDETCAVGTKSAQIRLLLMDGKATLGNETTSTEDGTNCLKRLCGENALKLNQLTTQMVSGLYGDFDTQWTTVKNGWSDTCFNQIGRIDNCLKRFSG